MRIVMAEVLVAVMVVVLNNVKALANIFLQQVVVVLVVVQVAPMSVKVDVEQDVKELAVVVQTRNNDRTTRII